MKKPFARALLIFLSLALCTTCLAMYLSVPRRLGMDEPGVSVQMLNGKPVVVVDPEDVLSQEHPPWAHQHLISVEFDYNKRTVTVVTLYVTFNPLFWGHIHSRWPIVIRRRFLRGDYALRYYDGDSNVEIGTLTFGEDGAATYRPLEARRNANPVAPDGRLNRRPSDVRMSFDRLLSLHARRRLRRR